jgi:hypothetical protein
MILTLNEEPPLIDQVSSDGVAIVQTNEHHAEIQEIGDD